jgi:hypothetical protein
VGKLGLKLAQPMKDFALATYEDDARGLLLFDKQQHACVVRRGVQPYGINTLAQKDLPLNQPSTINELS